MTFWVSLVIYSLFFSCCLQDPLVIFWYFNYMPQARSLRDPLCFLYLDICFLPKIWGIFSQNFLQIYFQFPFVFLLLLGSLLYEDWHALYYPISLRLLSFFYLSVFCCPDWVINIILSSMSLIHSSALFLLLFITFSSVFILAN